MIQSTLGSLLSTMCAGDPKVSLTSLLRSLTPPTPLRTSYPLKPEAVKSDKPFFLTTLNNRIKKCSGCGLMFQDLANPHPQPHGYILGHLEWDWFPGDDYQWKLGSLQNKYYHLKSSCIVQRCPSYQFPENMRNLQIDSNKQIPVSVRALLMQEFELGM